MEIRSIGISDFFSRRSKISNVSNRVCPCVCTKVTQLVRKVFAQRNFIHAYGRKIPGRLFFSSPKNDTMAAEFQKN